jgi:hypothetical protein
MAGGAALYHTLQNSDEHPVVVQKPIKANTIKRDYIHLSEEQCVKLLHDYDTGVPVLFIEPLKDDEYRAHAALGEREWSRDFTVEAGSSGNWKFYVGAAILGAGAAGYLTYKLVKR